MPIKIVELNLEEKNKLTKAIEQDKIFSVAKIQSLKKEMDFFDKCIKSNPKGATKEWFNDMKERMKIWSSKISDTSQYLDKYDTVLDNIKTSKEMSFKGLSHVIAELYNTEKNKKSLEAKYAYYPRLKIAKEKTIHVFANKIKTLMEEEYVKIA